jgi:hypothetical protein
LRGPGRASPRSSTFVAQSGDGRAWFAAFRRWLPQRSKDYNPI